MGKLKLKIATVVTEHRSAGKIEAKDRMRREGGMDFPGLCVASFTYINGKSH